MKPSEVKEILSHIISTLSDDPSELLGLKGYDVNTATTYLVSLSRKDKSYGSDREEMLCN